MEADFNESDIYTVKDGKNRVFGDVKNFIPILVAALKRTYLLFKEYDKNVGYIRDDDGDIIEGQEPQSGTILYKIKQLENQIISLSERVTVLENKHQENTGGA